MSVTVASLQTILTANTSQHDAAIAASAQKLGVLSTEGARSGTVLQQAGEKGAASMGAVQAATTKATTSVQQFGNEATVSKEKSAGLFSGISEGVGKIGMMGVAFGGAAMIGGELVKVMMDGVKAAAEEQSATDRLTVTVNNVAKGWTGGVAAIEPYIAEQGKLAFSHIQVENSLGRLVLSTHNVTEAEKLNAIAMDLARGKNIDLALAVNLVGKVHDGNIAILKRYGIVVKEGSTATEALGQIQSTFAGQAEKYGNSTAGAMDKLHNAFEQGLAKVMTALSPLLNVLISLLVPLITLIVDVASAILTVLKPAFDLIIFVVNAVGGALDWLGGLFGGFGTKVSDSMGIANTSSSDALGTMQTNFSDTGAVIQQTGTDTGDGYGVNLANGIYDEQGDITDQVNGVQTTMNITGPAGTLGHTVGSAWAGGPGGVTGGIRDNALNVSAAGAHAVNGLNHVQAAMDIGYECGVAFASAMASGAAGQAKGAAPNIQAAAAYVAGYGGSGTGNYEQNQAQNSQSWVGTSVPSGIVTGYMSTEAQAAEYARQHPTSPGPWTGGPAREGMSDPYGSQRGVTYTDTLGQVWATSQQRDSSNTSIEQYGGPKDPLAWSTTHPTSTAAASGAKAGGGGAKGGGAKGGGTSAAKSALQLAQEAANAVIDIVNKTSDAVTKGIAAIGLLGDFKLPGGFTAGVEAFGTGVQAVMQKLGTVAQNFGVDFLAHTTLFTDTAIKGMDLVSKGVDALGKLKDFAAPAAGSVDAFMNAVQYVTNKLGDIAGKWSIDALALMGFFADQTGKAMDMVVKAVAAMDKLRDFRKPSDNAMQSFVDALDYLTDLMRRVIDKWSKSTLEMLATFGTSVGTFVNGIGQAIVILGNLVTFKRPADDAINAFTDSLEYLVGNLKEWALTEWTPLIADAVGKIGDGLGKFVTGVGSAIAGLSSLVGFKRPADDAINSFRDSLLYLVGAFKNTVLTEWTPALALILGDVGAGIGKFASGVLGSVAGMTALMNFKAPGQDAITAFHDSLMGIVDAFKQVILTEWTPETANIAGLVGEGVGKLVTGLLSAIDPLIHLAVFVSPPQEVVDAFFNTLVTFITEFGARAADFKGQASPIMVSLASDIGAIVSGIGAAIDPLLKVGDAAKVDPAAIEGAFSNIYTMLTQFGIVMKGMPAGFAAEAAKFGSSVSAIFSAVKSGFDVATSIGGDTGGSIGSGFDTALTSAQGLVGYINGDATSGIVNFGKATDGLKTVVVTAWDAMTQAVKDYIAELALLPGAPPPGAPPPPPLNIPGFATGGVVTSKTLAWVGETEPEAIIPLSRMQLPPMGSRSGEGTGTTVMHNPIFIGGLQADATPDEHALLVSLGRRARRKNGGMSLAGVGS